MDFDNFENFESTGSVSQDALRLGFQTTCAKGIAKLLKVDDITTEECSSFKERHLIDLKNYISNFVEKESELTHIFKTRMEAIPYHIRNISGPFSWYKRHVWQKTIAAQKLRKFEIIINSIDDPILDIISGVWYSRIRYSRISYKWEGLYNGQYIEFDHTIEGFVEEFKTTARVCKVSYIPYKMYSERYIPDDVVDVVRQAIKIGMTDIMVARPVVEDAKEPNKDPIIVANVENQMYIIAWFGYNKDHMSCNF